LCLALAPLMLLAMLTSSSRRSSGTLASLRSSYLTVTHVSSPISGEHYTNVWVPTSKCAHHPQTDGQTKRANRTVEEMLCSYATPYRRNWDEYLVLPNLHTTIAFKQAQGSPLFTSTTTATLIHLCHWSQKSTAHHHVLPTLLPMILLDVPKQTFPVPKMPCIERNSANKNMQIKTADTLNILLETRSYSAQSAFPCTLKRVPPPNCTPNCTPSPPVPSPLSKSFHLWHTNCGCHHTWSVAMYFTSACSSLLNSSLRIFRNASSMPRHLSMLRTTKHYSLWITLRATKPAQLPAMQRQPAILSNGLDTPLGKNTEEPARNIAKGVPGKVAKYWAERQ